MGEKESLQRTLFLPVIMILSVLPLIVRAKTGYLEEAVAAVFRKDTYMEFYAQGKAIILIGVALLMILLMGMALAHKQLRIKRSKYIVIYTVGSGIFLLGAILSTILSEHKSLALLGVFDRAEGLLAILSYMVVMFYVVFVFNAEEHSKYIIGSLSFVVIACTILGATQYVGQDLILTDIGKKIVIPNSMAELRGMITNQFNYGIITCTLYNPNYVGSFSAMILPIFIALCFGKKKLGKRIFYMVITGCDLFLLAASKSSAGLVSAIMTLILGIILLVKRIMVSFKNYKKVVGISGICFVVAICATAPLWLDEFKWLSSQVGETLFTHHEQDDYLKEVAIKDVKTEGDRTIFKMAKGDLVIGRDKESLYFVDENNAPVEVENGKDTISIKDPRFEGYFIQKFYDKKDDKQIVALGLAQYNNRYNTENTYITLFTLAVKEAGVALIDSYTGKPLINNVAKSIGFAGKERVGTGRGYIWSRSIPLLKNTILIGKGPDNYALYFPQDDLIAKYYTYEAPNMVVDKPHNMYLQIGINLGCMALVGFLILTVTYMVQGIRLYGFKTEYSALDKFGISLTLGVFGYLVASLFNDSTVYVSPVFYTILGTGIAVNYLKTQRA